MGAKTQANVIHHIGLISITMPTSLDGPEKSKHDSEVSVMEDEDIDLNDQLESGEYLKCTGFCKD